MLYLYNIYIYISFLQLYIYIYYIILSIYIYILYIKYDNPEPGLQSFLIKTCFFPGGSVISHVNGIFLTLAALATII